MPLRSREDNLVENPVLNQRTCEIWRCEVRVVVSFERRSILKTLTKKRSWQSKCYQDTTHSGMLKRARERYEREVAGPDESRRKPCNIPLSLEGAQGIDR